MDRESSLYRLFVDELAFTPTQGQDKLFKKIASFLCDTDNDILVVNGYAGTGKTTALSAVITGLDRYNQKSILLAPTGRAAKTFSHYSQRNASTIHLHIYKQKTVSEDGIGQFSLSYNKDNNCIYVVDEVSLIAIDNYESERAFGSGNLLEDLISYVRSGDNNKLILLGDSAQLPPVGMSASPALSKDYMSMFSSVDFTSLKDVVRVGQNSSILYNATQIRYLLEKEDFNFISNEDFFLDLSLSEEIERLSGSELIDCISDAYARYGEDECIVLCRSNKRANKYNMGIRSMVQYKEEQLLRGDKLMIVKNCYNFKSPEKKKLDYIANGDIANLYKISNYTERYNLHFADASLDFSDYDIQIKAKICLDSLLTDSASLGRDVQTSLYHGLWQDYEHLKSKSKIYKAIKQDPYYNALQIKYAQAITCHKSQGGQWNCVFIDNPFWKDKLEVEDLKWLYTALTRAVKKVYLINFNDSFFQK